MFPKINKWAGTLLLSGIFSLVIPYFGYSDVITTSKGSIEGRILENSVKLLVVETIAGEYIVINKERVQSVDKEAPEEFFYRRAKYNESNKKENQALMDYLEVLNMNPGHSKAKDGIQAIQTKQQEAKVNAKITQAQNQESQKSFSQALKSYQEVLDMQPEERLASDIVKKMSETHARIAYLYYNHCLDQDAIVELAKAEELNPNSAEIYYVLGRIHETKRKFDIARLEYERALELNPSHSSARTQLMNLIERTRGRNLQ